MAWIRIHCVWSIVLASLPLVAGAAAPDFSGTWTPVASLSTPWPSPLPLTAAAQARLAAFDPDRDEPAGFCMPLGTPRNTLAGASPLEVLQQADRVYFVFQPDLLNVETRRVYLDGRPLPSAADRIPTWLGISRGRWVADSLVVETRDMEPQAILNAAGLSHGEQFVIRETWHLARDPQRGRLLIDEMVLEDPETFTRPVSMRRVFAWTPDAQLIEGRCSERLWIDTLWRHRLAEHAAAARARAVQPGAAVPASAAQPSSTAEPSR
jgi:hypothetical protein